MKLLKTGLEKAWELSKKNALVGRFTPLLEAIDEGIFGTDHTTDSEPHIRDGMDIKRFMFMVILALIPATLSAIYFYGYRVLLFIAVSYIFGGITEVAFAVIRKKPVHEGFLVTGLIYPLTMPPGAPLWVVAVGIVFGVIFGKEVFGGSGRNIFNPALVGRLFATIAFPSIMSTAWVAPGIDAVTSATPLSTFKTLGELTPLKDLWFGYAAGSIGETFRLGLVITGCMLVFWKISNWRIPVFYIGTVFVLSGAMHHVAPGQFPPALFAISTGGLMYGAFFMATDPVTAPFTMPGKVIFAILCGLFTVLIRSFSGYVEGVMFSIVIMNGFSPLIDEIVINVKYRKRANV